MVDFNDPAKSMKSKDSAGNEIVTRNEYRSGGTFDVYTGRVHPGAGLFHVGPQAEVFALVKKDFVPDRRRLIHCTIMR